VPYGLRDTMARIGVRRMNVFISRAGEDSVPAQQIAAILTEAGYTVTIQDTDFAAGSFPHNIQLAVGSADRFIAVYSPHYFAKEYTRAELYAAFARDPIGEHRFLIPVRVEPCTIPDLFKPFIVVDFVGKEPEPRRQALLKAMVPAGAAPKTPEIRTSIQKLPTADPHVFGRQAELDWLEQAWSNPDTNIIQIIAPGGAGKTALMTRWYRPHLADVTIFGWSFYSQGTREKREATSAPFFDELLRWFDIAVPPTESPFRKVDLLVARLRRERVLLILDGLEPLQDADGGLPDVLLRSLLQELAARNPGMVLVTTRVRLTDVPDEPPQAVSRDLENLDPADGARYLSHLGVDGPGDELRAASEAYDNHALALTLLGTYLVTFCKRDVRARTDIKELETDLTKPGRHARTVMASYARMYKDRPELEILRALGYFVRPAEPEALKLVMAPVDDFTYQAALTTLYDARLVLTTDPTGELDCHPLIREHFAREATPDGHARLFEHYKTKAPHLPDTLAEMTPLFYAVYHGCEAGRHQEALEELYYARLRRGSAFYLVDTLGAVGIELSLLTNFFANPWTQPEPTISPTDQPWVISEAAFALRALGRLAAAVSPMRASAEMYAKLEDWKAAATVYNNLSELNLTLGDIAAAITVARQAVELAERSGDPLERLEDRSALADALCQSGNVVEGMRLFSEAEQIQTEVEPASPMLHSYRYWDLLLSQGQCEQVVLRASQALSAAKTNPRLLDLGRDHLALGCALPAGSADAPYHLNQAVDFLRLSGQLDEFPRALLARATPDDLAEACRIASRCGMRLHLTDYHIISALRGLASGDREGAREHFHKAETLVAETGYHRRDPDLAELRSALS